MGGLAGHMSHVYADLHLSLGDIHAIIDGVGSGDIRISEKADGQNIFTSTATGVDLTLDDSGTVRIARNKGDIASGGKTPEKAREDFVAENKMVQALIFGDGGDAIEKILNSLDEQTKNEIFRDPDMPKVYINCEIIHEKKPNMLIYDKNYILFHNCACYASKKELADIYNPDDPDGEQNANDELDRKYDLLINALDSTEVQTQTVYDGNTVTMNWKVGGQQYMDNPQQRFVDDPESLEIFNNISEETKNKLTDYFKKFGLNKSNTTEELVQKHMEKNEFPSAFPGVSSDSYYEIGQIIMYSPRCSYMIKKLNIDTKNLDARQQTKIIKDYLSKTYGKPAMTLLTKTSNPEKGARAGMMAPIMIGLKVILLEYSKAVLRGADSVLAANPDLTQYVFRYVLQQRDMIEEKIREIYAEDQNKMEGNLDYLNIQYELLGDVDELATSIEGIVFDYIRKGKRMRYKFTGPFGPGNLIGGTGGFELKDELMRKGRESYFNKGNIKESLSIIMPKQNLKKLIRKMIISL